MKTKSLLFLMLLLLGSCSEDGNKKQTSKTLTIKTDMVKTVNMQQNKSFSFISKPYRKSELSFRIGGPIDKFDLFAGSQFRTGEIIAIIDDRDFAINKEKAQATYTLAKAEFERVETLYRKNNISASAYDKAKADYTTAKTAFEAASNDLSDTRLTAPFDGYVGEVFIEQYQDVKSSQKVVTLVDNSQIKIEVFVPQDIAFHANKIKNVNVCFDAMPNKIFKGKVAEVSKSTTPNNLSYLLTVLLANDKDELLSGMSGKLFFETNNDDQVSIVVPQKAICYNPQTGDYVWVLDPKTSKVNKRNITIGKIQKDGYVNIERGLREGEVVALTSLRFLSNNQTVKQV